MIERITRIVAVMTIAVLAMIVSAVPASYAQFADVQEQEAAAPPDEAAGDEAAATTLSADDLRALVAPVALYPDELLAIVLPAATNPLQIVEASRFLEQQKADPSLQPDASWDPAIIALLNYPQVVKQLNDDLGWTQDLGNAVMDQQEEVLAAIQTARGEASEAGYLQSNDQQNVTVTDNSSITIESTQPNVVYVPTYDPQTIVTNNYVGYPPPVYSDPYPAYYAPGATFLAGAIVGASFAYAFDWNDNDIDIDCCGGGGDIDIDNDININRGDVNIGSGNTNIDKSKIQNKFNGANAKAGTNGKMKWSPEKARQKSTAARKPAGAKPTSANISKQLGNNKAAGAAKPRVQSGKTAQKQSQRGQGSLATASKKNPNVKKQALQKQPQKQRQAQQQRPNKQLQQKQLKQKQGGAFNQQKAPKQKVKSQSNRGQKSLQKSGNPRPKRR